MPEANERRLLQAVAALLLLWLAPLGAAFTERPRLEGAPLSTLDASSASRSSSLGPDERSLELAAPDLLALALRVEAGGSAARLASELRTSPHDLSAWALRAGSGLAVPEPSAAALLFASAAGALAARRPRPAHAPKRGFRFSRNASMPSIASASSRLSAITALASR